jgi:hypothetical protein
MIVVTNLNDAKQATQGFTTVHFGFSKPNFIQRLTPEFDNIITEGKKFGNKTIASFWYLHQIHDFIYPENIVEAAEVIEWDKDGCVAWAESHGIDIVWAPELADEISLVDKYNLQYYKALLNKIWNEENYSRFSTDIHNMEKKKGDFVSRLMCNTGWKYATSISDGITAFLKIHFTNKYTDSRCIIVDTIRSPEGLHYSASYSKYSAKEKEVLARVEPTILAFDFTRDLGELSDAIVSTGSEIGLKVRTLNKFVDNEVIGPGKTLIDSYIYIDAVNELDRKYEHFVVIK